MLDAKLNAATLPQPVSAPLYMHRALDRLRGFADALTRVLGVRDGERLQAAVQNTSKLQGPLECLLADRIYPSIRDLSTFLVSLAPPSIRTALPRQPEAILTTSLEILAAIQSDLDEALAVGHDLEDPSPLHHVLKAYLQPAIAELGSLQQPTTDEHTQLFAQASRDLLGPRTLLPESDPAELTPAISPEKVDFKVFSLYGRWFAAWRNTSSTDEPDSYEFVLIEQSGRRGKLSYTDL